MSARHLAAALALAILLCLLGVGLAVSRAEEAEIGRDTPSARGNRPAQLERSDVVDLAAEVFGVELAPYVAAIAGCESSLQPGADTNWPYVGLMQIDPGLHRHRLERVVGYPLTLAEARALLVDPLLNLLVAADVLREQGFGAWPVCRWAS